MPGFINREAVFSDGTKRYVNPPEPMEYDEVTIRLRVAKEDIDYAALVLDSGNIAMKKWKTDTYFDYYEATFWMGNESVCYHFMMQKGNEMLYFNQEGVVEQPSAYYNFRLIPGYKTPDWAKGAVMYQIYVDRFFNGDASTTVEEREYTYIGEHVTKVREWNKYPASMGVREFYGGDLRGVLKKLDYLKELGVEVIYLNPIFVSPSNHKYDTQDYDYVDPHLTVIREDGGQVLDDGDKDNRHATKYIKRVTDVENLEASNEFFAMFVDEVHKHGMRVILDGVFNHCGSFNKWMDKERIYEYQEGYEKGAYISKHSPYTTFFEFGEEDWPYNNCYDGWWGHDTLPKLNYENSNKLFSYIMRIAKKWIRAPYNVDGWRLDVAADVGHSEEFNHHFWKEFRKSVKEENPEALILAEHYGDVTPWLSGGEWDSVMNYDAFMEPITWFLTGMEKHSELFRGDLLGNDKAFWSAMRKYSVRFTCQSVQVAMNELSNHDHSRFLTRTNHIEGKVSFLGPHMADAGVNRAVMMAGVLFQMTWTGAPTIYYGDEVGLCGFTDPDNRRTFPWGGEDEELYRCHKELIRIHKDYDAIRVGSTIHLYSQMNFISYGRFDDSDQLAVAISVSPEAVQMRIPVWKMGIKPGQVMLRIAKSGSYGFSIAVDVRYVDEEGYLTIDLEPFGAVIYKNHNI